MKAGLICLILLSIVYCYSLIRYMHMDRENSTAVVPKEEVELIKKELKAKLNTTALPDSARKVFFPWDDVVDSISRYPERVYESSTVCPVCGKKSLKIHFSSPEWTWQKLCGRAGTMHICCHCPSQIAFRLEIMN